jgi:hypothetical protein
VWLVVLVGVGALVVGLAIGGVAGYSAGVASGLMDVVGDPFAEVGPDALTGTGAVDAGRIDVGQFAVTDLDVKADFADDFFAEATITNEGSAWEGGAIEINLLRDRQRLGQVGGELPALESGESVRLELWGFDDYDSSVDQVEIRIG